MARYAVLDASGVTQNVILWDGASELYLPEGWHALPEDKAPPLSPEVAAALISAGDFFNRFTPAEQFAISAACTRLPALHVGLVNGLAAGRIDLASDTLAQWLDGLIAAGALMPIRKAELTRR